MTGERGGGFNEEAHHDTEKKGDGGKGLIEGLVSGLAEGAWNNGLGLGESALYKGGKSPRGAGGPKHPVG